MILNVGFEYMATVRRHRRRDGEARCYAASMSVALREVAEEEAPVAAWWSPYLSNVGDGRIAVRAAEGRLWQPVLGGPHGGWCMVDGSRAEMDAEPDTRFAKGGSASSPAGILRASSLASRLAARPLFEGKEASTRAAIEDDAEVAEVLADHRERYEAHVASHFANLASVGGVLHATVAPPVAVVRTREWRELHTGTPDDFRYDMDQWSHYPLARFDEASTAAGFEEHELARLRPEVLLPEALSFDEEEYVVRRTAEAVVERFARLGNENGGRKGSHLSNYPDAVVLSYVDLRDAVEAAAPVDAVLSSAEAFASATSGIGQLRAEHGALRGMAERVARDRERSNDETHLLGAWS